MPEENARGVKDDGRNPFKEFGVRRVVRVGRGRLETTLVFPRPFRGKVSRLDSTRLRGLVLRAGGGGSEKMAWGG